MQGKHHYQPELFSTFNIEELIPKNHLLRKIDGILDLSFVRELTESFYSKNFGRPSIDPEVFVRMVLLEYFYDVPSDRQLCEELRYNLAYRWFCRFSMQDSIPDHSSMTRIRDRLGEETFKKIFYQVVELCRKNGLIKGERLMADGSMIYANASLYNMEERNADAPGNDDDAGPSAGASGYAGSKDGLSNSNLKKIPL